MEFTPTHLQKSGRRNSGVVAVSTPFLTNTRMYPAGVAMADHVDPTLALLRASYQATYEPGVEARLISLSAYFTPRAAGISRKACCTDLAGRVRYATGVFSTWGSTAR